MKRFLAIITLFGLAACAFPRTPDESDLLNGAKQFRPELFNSGARGQVIASISDNASSSGFFGKKYRDVVAFKNLQSGAVSYLATRIEDKDYDAAMLPIGKYQVVNLYMEYIYTTTQHTRNATITTTHVEKHEHFEGNKKITFDVKPGEVTYLGHIDLIKSDNAVDKEGAKIVNAFKISDKSADIPSSQKQTWEKEFGKPFVARMMSAAK